jgi:hypothetical protein
MNMKRAAFTKCPVLYGNNESLHLQRLPARLQRLTLFQFDHFSNQQSL